MRSPRGLIRFARGDERGAESDLLAGLPLARDAGDPQMVIPILAARFQVDRRTGHRAEASDEARELLEILRGRPVRLDALIELALAAPDLELVDELRGVLGSVRMRTRWVPAARLILDGRLEEAADALAEIGDLPHEAQLRQMAAERLRAEGRTASADEQLERALAFWRSVGARRYLAAAGGVGAIAS